ncbi:MAG: hypothetical protein AB1630_04465 [bacterium]
MRWLIIALAILSVVLIAKENATKPEIFIPLLIITFYNLIANFLYKKITTFRICYLESMLDIFFVSSLIASTGGIKSPFYLFYFLILIFAACYYRTKGAIILGFVISFIYLLVFFISKDISLFPYLLIRIPLFVVMAGMGSVLVSETMLCEEALEDERQQAKILQPQLQSTMYELNMESKRLQELCSISLKMDEELPFKKRLDYIIQEIMGFLKTDINIIFLLNPETGRLEPVASSGKSLVSIPQFKIGEGFVGGAVKEGKTIIINDVYMKDESNYSFFKEIKLLSAISVCLGLPDSREGLILCGSYAKRRFSDKEKIFLELISNVVSLHLKNDRFYEEINRLSITDNETALFAYSFFENKLKEEFARSMRILRPLSLIIIKLELPSNLSEIQKIGLIINSQTRADDIVSYNDGRFYILALRTGRNKIMILVDRIKREIEAKTGYFPVIGISSYPSSETSHIEFLRSANSALASAFKHKDRVVIANG